MFDQTFVNTGGQTNKPWSVAVSLATQGLLVGAALLAPILHPDILYPKVSTPIWVHLQPIKEIPKVESREVVATHSVLHRAFIGPTKVPERTVQVVDTNIGQAVPESFAPMGPGLGSGTQTVGDLFGNLLPPTQPAPQVREPPKPRAEPAPSGPVAVSSGVQAAKLIFGPKPAYPPLARAARVQGTVRIQALISADGTIHSLQVMSGPPLLIAAARDAVSQWRYQATLLSGRAVEVITEIDVIFTLGN